MKKPLMVLAFVVLVAILVVPNDFAFGRGGGGGGRGGGGGGRGGGFSGGGGSVRYSGGGSRAMARPSAPVARPSTPVARPSTPIARPSAPVARPSTPVARPSVPAARPNTSMAYRPNNYGSMLNRPSQPIARPIGGGSVQGPGGGTVGAIRGPGGSWAIGGKGPGGGAAVIAKGPGGGAAIARLPNGANYINWHGGNYWRYGWGWYRPYYYGGAVYYEEVPAPAGYTATSLPAEATPVTADDKTYYTVGESYYEKKGDGQYVAVAPPSDASTAPSVPDPRALAMLKRISDFLGSIQAAKVTVRDQTDEILESGQKVQMESTRKISMRAPNRMAVDYSSEGVTRRVVYDGTALTVYEKQKNVYARKEMPPTLVETMDVLASKYGMAVPAVEAFRPGLIDRLKPQIRSAGYLEMQKGDGSSVKMISLGMEWADVQFWIQDGDNPLPTKVIITYKQVPTSPRYVMHFEGWDLAPADLAFDAGVPLDAVKIDLVPLNATAQK